MAISTGSTEVVRKNFTFEGADRSYFLYEPGDRKQEEQLPLIITLHGSGGDARMLVDHWKDIAERERVILVGPLSHAGRGWNLATDSPDFFQTLVDRAVKEHGADPRRVYLFGFSAGGHHAMSLAVLESEYFAAAGVYAGVLMPELNQAAEIAERRIPIVVIGARRDNVVPPPYLEDTRARLNHWGWDARLHMVNNDHNYRAVSKDINRIAWELFKKTKLDADPKFKRYKIGD